MTDVQTGQVSVEAITAGHSMPSVGKLMVEALHRMPAPVRAGKFSLEVAYPIQGGGGVSTPKRKRRVCFVVT